VLLPLEGLERRPCHPPVPPPGEAGGDAAAAAATPQAPPPRPRAAAVGPGVLAEAPVVIGYGPDFVDLEWAMREVGHRGNSVASCELEQLRLPGAAGGGAPGQPAPGQGQPPRPAVGPGSCSVELRSAGRDLVPERRVVWRGRAERLRHGQPYVFRAVAATRDFGPCHPGPWSQPFCTPKAPALPSVPHAEAVCTATFADCLPEGVGLARVAWHVDAMSGSAAAMLEVQGCEVQQRVAAGGAGEAAPGGCRFLLPPRAVSTVQGTTGLVQAWECVVEMPAEFEEHALSHHRNTTAFQFRVRAWNGAGAGLWSAWSAAVSGQQAAAARCEAARRARRGGPGGAL